MIEYYSSFHFDKTVKFLINQGYELNNLLSYHKDYLLSKKNQNYRLKNLNYFAIELNIPFIALIQLTLFPIYQKKNWKIDSMKCFSLKEKQQIYNNKFLFPKSYSLAIKKTRITKHLTMKNIENKFRYFCNYNPTSYINQIEEKNKKRFSYINSKTFFRICYAYDIEPISLMLEIYKIQSKYYCNRNVFTNIG